MRPLVLASLALPLVLGACALTPRQQCEAPFRAELRTVTTEISETRQAIDRGFRLVPARWAFGVHYCVRPTGFVHLCTADDGEPMYDKRPVNRRAERAKLNALVAERQRLNAAIARCAATYPE